MSLNGDVGRARAALLRHTGTLTHILTLALVQSSSLPSSMFTMILEPALGVLQLDTAVLQLTLTRKTRWMCGMQRWSAGPALAGAASSKTIYQTDK